MAIYKSNQSFQKEDLYRTLERLVLDSVSEESLKNELIVKFHKSFPYHKMNSKEIEYMIDFLESLINKLIWK